MTFIFITGLVVCKDGATMTDMIATREYLVEHLLPWPGLDSAWLGTYEGMGAVKLAMRERGWLNDSTTHAAGYFVTFYKSPALHAEAIAETEPIAVALAAEAALREGER